MSSAIAANGRAGIIANPSPPDPEQTLAAFRQAHWGRSPEEWEALMAQVRGEG